MISSRSGGTGEVALGFFAPALVGESVLAGDSSSDLVDEKLAEGDVDGRGRLEIADGREDIRSNGGLNCVMFLMRLTNRLYWTWVRLA